MHEVASPYSPIDADDVLGRQAILEKGHGGLEIGDSDGFLLLRVLKVGSMETWQRGMKQFKAIHLK